MIIQDIKKILHSWFDFPKKPLFCQVSTVKNGYPHLRTMALYDVTADGSLIFLTNNKSGKWSDLEKSPYVAVCLLNVDLGQITVEGSALLYSQNSSSKSDSLALTTFYWENYLPKYWQDFYLSYDKALIKAENINAKSIPSSFGVIKIVPNSWEILEAEPDDFLNGSRKRFTLKNKEWTMVKLPIE